jgi:hypothetical protein
MKTKLGILGTLICSAGLLALPAVAQSRGNYGNSNTQNNSQRYAGNSQVYNQTPAPVAQPYGQRYTGNSQVYNQAPAVQSYGQRYTGSAQSYTSGYSRNEFRGDDRYDREREREREWRRHEHYRRDRWDWR